MAEACPHCPMNWYALTVKSQHEKAVDDQLQAKALESYLPLYRARSRWSDRIKTIELPLFSRYVFCRFGFEDRLKVLSVSSIVSIVGFGGKHCPTTRSRAFKPSSAPVCPSLHGRSCALGSACAFAKAPWKGWKVSWPGRNPATGESSMWNCS